MNERQKMKVDNGGIHNKEVNFPSNSNKSKAATVEPKKLEKVISGSVRTQKKGLGKKMAETFFDEAVPSVGGFILHDVLIPALKSMIYDMFTGGLEMSLFGERGSKNKRDKRGTYVSYNNYSNKRDDRDRDRDRRDQSPRNRSRHNFDDIVLDSRGEAEEVLSNLVDQIEDYDVATVADLYGLVGITSTFADHKYGWDNLSHAAISRVRNGYLIDLPKPQVLD